MHLRETIHRLGLLLLTDLVGGTSQPPIVGERHWIGSAEIRYSL
jgi:hypothetical protein